LGGTKGIWPVKTEWWGAGMVICLERGAAQLMPLPLTLSCFSKIQIGFYLSGTPPAHPGSPGQRAVKRVCMLNELYRDCLLFAIIWQLKDVTKC